MSVTLVLQNSINFVRPILKMQPINVTSQEPGITAGNIVLQTMLSPPFKWPFNRTSSSFGISTAGGTDYARAIPDLGFLETQWLTDATGYVYELNGAVSLAISADTGRPSEMSQQFDDNQGNITFRVKPSPDQAYIVFLNYQKKPALLTSYGSPWGPVSDHFSFVYNFGFLTILSLLTNDSRFPIFEQWFVSRLLGVQDGLTEQEKIIFLGNWQALMATLNRSAGAVQSGLAGRAK